MSIGTRIKERREALHMTQVELAEKMGVTKGAIGNYEVDASSPKASLLFKLFECLDCDANYLFQDEMVEIDAPNQSAQEERDLLRYFRRLNPSGRAQLLQIAANFAQVPDLQDGAARALA